MGGLPHKRACDKAAGSISPQKLYGTPVGLMFFEGAPRLRRSGATVPGLQLGDPQRIVVEAYPGIMARSIIGRQPYKQDTKAKQTTEQHKARRDMLKTILEGDIYDTYGVKVKAPLTLADDPTGDQLDALLCCIQAAWAWQRRTEQFGMPTNMDSLEGWLCDPHIVK